MSDCDECHELTDEGMMIYTGEWSEGHNAPYVKFYCHPCYHSVHFSSVS